VFSSVSGIPLHSRRKKEVMPVIESEVEPEVERRHQPSPLSHLRLLEAESIHILREVASEFEKPVMLYSIGKDSSVMLRLAQKAFFPGQSRSRCCTSIPASSSRDARVSRPHGRVLGARTAGLAQ
jgi:hypothetical protein